MGSAEAGFTLGRALLLVTKTANSTQVSELLLTEARRADVEPPMVQRAPLLVSEEGLLADVRASVSSDAMVARVACT